MLEGESELKYLWRVDNLVRGGKYTNWREITPIINKELYTDETDYCDESSFRKKCKYARDFYEAGVFDTYKEDAYFKEVEIQKRELEKNKIKFRDERTAWQKQNFIGARVEEKLDNLEEVFKEQGKVNFEIDDIVDVTSDNDMLVILSDWHIGQCFSSIFGEYNTDIAKDRINKLLNEVIRIRKLHNSENCYISLQGDLISNNIHKTIAITNRENVIEQIKMASTLISSFTYELTKHFKQVYQTNVSGNHSRIDRKNDALHNERLDDLIGWNIDMSLKHIENFHFIKNTIDIGISEMDIRGKKYINIHGDYDSFSKQGVASLSLLLKFIPYAITFGHKHFPAFSAESGVKIVQGGSLSGSGDDFTIEKRLCGEPSQMVCICTDEGIQTYYPIELK